LRTRLEKIDAKMSDDVVTALAGDPEPA
jgi:hypothetical protein